MPLLPIPSLHTWINRVTRATNRSRSALAPKHDHTHHTTRRQQHALHHLLKSLGHLPDPWLNKISAALDPDGTRYAHTLGASAAHIVLAGDSAGGNLAIITAQQVSRPNPKLWQSIASAQHSFDAQFIDSWQDIPPPFALWPLYPVTDSASHYPSWDMYGQGLLLDHNDVEIFDRAYLQDRMPRNHALISPMYGDNQQMCPTYLVTAELDILRDEGLAFAEQLQHEGIEVVTQTVLGAPHGFIHLMSVHQGMGEQTRTLIDTFARFVQQLTCKHDDA